MTPLKLKGLPELPSREDVEAALARMSADELREVDEMIATTRVDWAPMPGPQLAAFLSPADILLFGGAAGGGKTDLLLGCAGLNHYRSVIFRRVYPSLRSIVDRSRGMFNPEGSVAGLDRYNESLHRWRLGGTAFSPQIEFASLQHEKDVLQQQGQPRDYYGFDELTEFTEYQFRFVTGWNRTTRPGQRCRIVATCNPPTTKEGRWIISYFAPWLDEKHPKPAVPGELRWFTTIGGRDHEVDGPDPVVINGETIIPKSRTFIPASVHDNPYLVRSGYVSTLQALPEPLRSILLYGDFKAGIEDDPWQLIPTAWVRDAQARWRNVGGKPPAGARMDQMGVDVSRGGKDRTVLTPRYGNFFGAQKAVPGRMVEDGDRVVQLVVEATPIHTIVVVDVIGVGSSAFDGLKGRRSAFAMNGAAACNWRDKSNKLTFVNMRAGFHWKMREMFDPANGYNPAIPDDPELLADLTAATWELTRTGIKIEAKEDIAERLGRSPDKGESLMYAAVPCNPMDVTNGSAFSSSSPAAEGSPWSPHGNNENELGVGERYLS